MMSPHKNSSLTIGGVAKLSGVSIETIRYYERIGLLAEPVRDTNGYRSYSAEQADAVIFISRSRKLGFALSTIRDLMRLAECDEHCEKVRAATLRHRNNVRQQIDALRQIERALNELVDKCGPDTHPNCPIIDELKKRQ